MRSEKEGRSGEQETFRAEQRDAPLLSYGSGSRRITIEARYLGEQILALIYNENAHIGAVALAEYDAATSRSSVSVLTRPSHKDDVVAASAAQALSKHGRRTVCVAVGIHIDRATTEDIQETVSNAERVVQMLIESGFDQPED